MWRIALRMLLGDRPKYLALVCGLGFAVLLISQQAAIFMGLLIRATGPLQNVAQPDLWVANKFVRYVSETRALSDEDLSRVRSTPGVLWAEPFFSSRVQCDLPSGNSRYIQLVGIDRTTMVGQPPVVTEGRLEDLRIEGAVLVEESARSKLENVRIGDTLKLNDRRAIVVGYCRAKPGFDSPAVVYTTYANCLRFVPLGRNAMTYVLVKVRPGADVRRVQEEIGRLPDVAAFTHAEMTDRTVRFILIETGIGINFGITVLLGLIVGLAVSGAIFYQFTMENSRNYAVLKAMGARRGALIGMVLLQAVWVGLIGYGVGVGCTALFTLQSRQPGMELAAYFPWQLLVGSLVGMILCISVGSLLSLRRVLRLEPAVVFK
ncbi:MAG: ABC transporter permease [Phycisphaeraceae bacterium]|nr:ABC transporter permease [Phycisphaeraceae bacterium]